MEAPQAPPGLFSNRPSAGEARQKVLQDMELWTEVRRRVLTGELSRRQAATEYGLNYRTVAKACEHVEPPGYRRTSPRTRPKMEPYLPRIAEILEADKRAPPKQRHTARRIFDRLREEHGYDGCYESVKEAVREWRQGNQEVFLPLSHPPGEAQVDFGYAYVALPDCPTMLPTVSVSVDHLAGRFADSDWLREQLG